MIPQRSNYSNVDDWAEALVRYLEDLRIDNEALASASPPIGSQVYWSAASAPAGWLFCDGAAYATSRYPTLSAIMGGGPATFNVPTAAGRIIRAI